ncbi:MAG TPA: hydroxysqualene dehydroxylase HpnE [Candidatus Dormibacteraeota bacterium]|jgi:squalene-associated FAD-dependent desaturase|nr:hydroxysqualene dehydroxylase HpnE [Candidatus Dormibacteraeota bacterium]
MSSKNVIVIGGGLAGLAAGVALAESGWRVRLFELRPYLGGRATSYVLPSGEHVDNCQHVTLGCCTNLDDFYRRVGSASKVKFFDRLFFLDPQGRSGAMQAGILPAPFHMTGSFATFAPLSLGDKLSIARAMMRVLFTAGKPKEVATPAGISMLDWLRSQKQTPRAIERFWRVVLVSALDEELHRTDARFGIDVFWKAFLSNRTGYRMGVPAVPLAELYDGCRIAIEKRGGEVTLRAPVRGVRVENGAIVAVQFDNGREESADAYVFALPHTALDNLLPPEIKSTNPSLASLEKIKVSPITGVHFWFDRPVTTEPFITLLDTNVQWVFNKTALYTNQSDAPVPGAQQYLQLVISASYDLLKKSREEIIEICLKEIRQALPAAREAKLVKATVIKEASATFSPEPGVDRLRPAQTTNTPRLFLAGDWTATGWPATMEGAVRSGYLAAEAVLRSVGSPAKFLQPDLAPTGLSKLFAR